jgi:hypothetical protein
MKSAIKREREMHRYTGCPDERYPEYNNYISESIYYTHLWATPLQMEIVRVFSE